MTNHQPVSSIKALSDFRCQLLLSAGYLFLIFLWSTSIAFNGAPDESTHFFLLEFLKAFHALPIPSEPLEAMTGPISGHTWQKGDFWYHGLPFPHIVGALVTTYIGGWFIPSDALYMAARSFNWLLGCVFICALFRTARTIGLPLLLSAGIAACVSAIPQVTFVFSYLNSDAYGLASIGLLISTMTGLIKSPIRKRSLYFGVSVGLMLMAKLYFIPALVFAISVILANRIFKNKAILAHLPTMIVAAMAVSVPMLILVYLKYGEISGISGQLAFVEMHKLNPAAGFGTCYLNCHGGLINTKTVSEWLNLTLMSYFSVTGWMNIFIANAYYKIAGIILLAIMAVSVYQVKPLSANESKREIALNYALPVAMIIALYPAITLLSLLASQSSLPQPQGRYLFVTIPFIGLLLSMTAQRIIARNNK